MKKRMRREKSGKYLCRGRGRDRGRGRGRGRGRRVGREERQATCHPTLPRTVFHPTISRATRLEVGEADAGCKAFRRCGRIHSIIKIIMRQLQDHLVWVPCTNPSGQRTWAPARVEVCLRASAAAAAAAAAVPHHYWLKK